ncbi:MAG: TIGR00269 family protein [Deltaproteobacteria bacterium]
MKCKRCRKARAAIELPSHHTAFCPDCFFVFFRRQVTEGIRKLSLLSREDRVLVCVSGGKDSLVLWDILMELGYDTEGLYIDLGIPGYSERSREKVEAYAASRGKEPIVVDLRAEGVPIPEAARKSRKQECAVCGTVKRYFFNRIAAERGFSVVATGHNLDDEAARLLGNLLHWQEEHLERQHPLLPEAGAGLVRKVKPLWRVSERETAAYGILKGIDFVTEECPMSVDATSLVYKEALALLEEAMPGTRGRFYHGFLLTKKSKGTFLKLFMSGGKPSSGHAEPEENGEDLPGEGAGTCGECGAPSFAEVCSYCRLREKVAGHRAKTGGG